MPPQNLALRQQLAVPKCTTKRPKLSTADRAFWGALLRLWTGWQHALVLVKPESVIRWDRKVSSSIGPGRVDTEAGVHGSMQRSECSSVEWLARIRTVSARPPTEARSLRFPWSAGCIIATRDARPRYGFPSHNSRRAGARTARTACGEDRCLASLAGFDPSATWVRV